MKADRRGPVKQAEARLQGFLGDLLGRQESLYLLCQLEQFVWLQAYSLRAEVKLPATPDEGVP